MPSGRIGPVRRARIRDAAYRGEDGKVVLILHRVEEVTELMRARGRAGAAAGDRARVLEAELAATTGPRLCPGPRIEPSRG
ncbi:hypothetical protein [Streptomyces sp. HUAS TT7]|uniref:hypothetical protein n=1 Tax=Streptomyces sp. HUAS TT7 TaxID=3447507 RepID=UPI003F660723